MTATAERKKPRKGQRARRAAQLRARQAWVRARYGVIVNEMATNLPNKSQLKGPEQQARWLEEILPENGVASIAECYPALGRELRQRGLRVHDDYSNPGGVGNALVSHKKLHHPQEYRCTFRANNNAHVSLTMVRAQRRYSKRIYHTHDGIHSPSTGKYKTSASPAEKASVIRHIARHNAPTRSRSVSGDWNGDREWVLAVLRSVDGRWQYLGGHGVEMTFGINCKKFEGSSFTYGRMSDHHATGRAVYGIRGRLG